MKSPKLPLTQAPGLLDDFAWMGFRMGSRMEELRNAHEQGCLPALHDAIKLCLESGYPTPDWANKGSLAVIGDRLENGFVTGKGASGNELTKHVKTMERYIRYCAVKIVFENGACTLSIASAVANKILKSAVSNEMMGRSYKTVKRHLNDPIEKLQYYSGQMDAQRRTKTKVHAQLKALKSQ